MCNAGALVLPVAPGGGRLADHCDQVSDRLQNLGTYAGDIDQIIHTPERAILVAVVDDRLGLRRADPRQ